MLVLCPWRCRDRGRGTGEDLLALGGSRRFRRSGIASATRWRSHAACITSVRLAEISAISSGPPSCLPVPSRFGAQTDSAVVRPPCTVSATSISTRTRCSPPSATTRGASARTSARKRETCGWRCTASRGSPPSPLEHEDRAATAEPPVEARRAARAPNRLPHGRGRASPLRAEPHPTTHQRWMSTAPASRTQQTLTCSPQRPRSSTGSAKDAAGEEQADRREGPPATAGGVQLAPRTSPTRTHPFSAGEECRPWVVGIPATPAGFPADQRVTIRPWQFQVPLKLTAPPLFLNAPLVSVWWLSVIG